MEGMKLIGFGENITIEIQKERGKGKKNPFNVQQWQSANTISLDLTYLFDTPGDSPSITFEDIKDIAPKVIKAHRMLTKDEGDIYDNGIPMTGWQNLPEKITQDHLADIKSAARNLSSRIDAFVSLGIGGSYLGIETTIKALTHTYFNQLSRKERGDAPEIYFLGQNMDPDYFRDTLDMLKGKMIGINVISKSGTTTETAIAFRILRNVIEKNWGQEAKNLIYVTTDTVRGGLQKLSKDKGYKTFSIPDNIGGRYSVLTDVGLLGLAMTNIDIEEFAAGFKYMRRITMSDDLWKNPSLLHAAARYAAWLKGKKIEVVATNSASLYGVARWMEQLFPESEGHSGHGMWVSPSLYSEKLHANGQMVQQGERNLLETFIMLKEHDNRVYIPQDEGNLDGLNFIPDKGRDMNSINRIVIEGPAYAHYLGAVPNMVIEIPRRTAFCLGQIFYMMERSVAISGYLFGHNPFIQPGVEDYKKAMFALLEKPGFEEKGKEIKDNISKMKKIRI
jgi:glucose-6-phosphate isomerase